MRTITIILSASFILAAGCAGKNIYSVSVNDTGAVRKIAKESSSVAEYSKKVFTSSYYGKNIAESGNTLVINANDNEQFTDIKILYANYCASKNGKFQKYTPPGMGPAVTAGFNNQNVFYHDSLMGRTEYEWCLVAGRPVFAAAQAGQKGKTASTLKIIEKKDMEKLIKTRTDLVLGFAESSKKVFAFFRSKEVLGEDELKLNTVEFNFMGGKPRIDAAFANTAKKPQPVEFTTIALMVDTENYLFEPEYSGGKAGVSVNEKECILNKDKTVLTVPAGKSCTVKINYSKNSEMQTPPFVKTTLFFAGKAILMEPYSEFDTKNSSVWLKPRLDKSR